MANSIKIDDLLAGDEGKFGYLFPYRDSVPKITNHPFSDLKFNNQPISEYLVSKMLDPDYLGWTVKVLLNQDLFPFQISTLQILWRTTFPMLVGCRGGSKCIRGDSLCRTNNGLLQIDEIIDSKLPVFEQAHVNCLLEGENGYRRPTYGWNNGYSQTKKITLKSGIEIEGTNNHPVRCLDVNGKIVWKNLDQISNGDIIPIVRDQFDFGNDNTTSEDLGWWLGVMVGDGMFTQRNTLCFTNCNKSVVGEFFRITKSEFDYTPKTIKRAGQYNIYNVAIWDKLDRFYQIGNRDSYTKEVPLLIRRSSRKVVAAFIRGLFDADGCVLQDRTRIVYSSCSEKLIRQVQQLLLGFGITCSIKLRRNKCQTGAVVTCFVLSISDKQNIKLFKRYINFVHDIKRNRLEYIATKKHNTNKNVIYNIQNILRRVRKKFDLNTGGSNTKGQGPKNTLVMPPSRIGLYNISYDKLYNFLQQTKPISNDEDWQYLQTLYNKNYYYDIVVDVEDSYCQTFDVHIKDDHSFISNGIISHNSYMLAVYAILRALLDQGSKIVIVGAGLRQAKLVFNYIENIWNQSPVLRNIIGGGKKSGPRQNVDLCYFRIGESIVYALPLGDGTRIRGFRATVVIADEFAAIPPDVFDIVVRGFTATTKTPVDEARQNAIDKKLNDLGVPIDITKNLFGKKIKGNQIIYSGTAYYEFNHFAQKFRMWKDIIYSNNNLEEVSRIFGGSNMIPDNFDSRDYAIIRIPHTHLPDGLLDKKQLTHAKAILPKNIYLMEYGAVFVSDSDGFFSRSLIEKCTCYPGKTISTLDGDVEFVHLMQGIRGRKYVMGVDPAAERDNLTITVVEVWANHSRVVYCWAVNKETFEKRKKQGFVNQQDYYEYCCYKIREVHKAFKAERIEMDSQGGGYAISEMLRNKKLLNQDNDDYPIYEIIDPEDPKEMDGESDGPHILNLVKQSSEFNAQANVCLHKSFETRKLLFPAIDVVRMQAALVAEVSANINFDTFEENVDNIEELKNELCTIQMTETSTGKERFDTPTVVQPGSVEGRQRKGRLKKDRYTSLLLAHKYIYDNEVTFKTEIDYEDVAGNFQIVKGVNPNQKMYKGPGASVLEKKGPGQNCYGATQGGEIF